MTGVLIVGAGQAGAQAAISLRQGGYDGAITLVGEESDPPYERPPLSKEYLAGDKPAERLALRPPAFWAERGVALRAGVRIEAVDARARAARAAGGEAFGYDRLIWAAGGHARQLPVPGAELAGVHRIRTRTDVDLLRADLAGASSVLVVGGGYVGLESAAVCAKAGRRVTLVEHAPRLLARVAGAAVGDFYAAEHRGRGVDVRLGTGLARLRGANGRVTGAELSDGTMVDCEVVIVGVGLLPAAGVLALAGAEVRDGVVVDAHGRTSLPHVYAVGDCARGPCAWSPTGEARIESVANAVETAKAAAAHIVLGDAAPVQAPVPWFWSNQYDLRLQTVGLSAGHDAAVVRGAPGSGGWSLVYLRAGVVVALDCINAPRDYVQGKALVERHARADPALLADPQVPLKTLLG